MDESVFLLLEECCQFN